MSLFDSIVKTALESATQASGSGGSGIAEVVLSFVQSQGGLEGIQKKFEEKGYGEIITSWFSNAENLPISGEDIIKIFGSNTVSDIAAKAGVSKDGASDQIATVLPVLLNGLTPDGKVSGEDLLKTGMDIFKKNLFS